MAGKKAILLMVLALFLGATATTLVWTATQAAPAGPTATFSIPWWTVDNGGGTSQGGAYLLRGTGGQPDAGEMAGGDYTLRSGFWSDVPGYIVYLPLIAR